MPALLIFQAFHLHFALMNLPSWTPGQRPPLMWRLVVKFSPGLPSHLTVEWMTRKGSQVRCRSHHPPVWRQVKKTQHYHHISTLHASMA